MEKDDMMLSGVLYDLKQTADRKASPKDYIKSGGYFEVLTKFIESSFDPESIKEFYRAEKPLYSSHIFIPTINASDGPKAFGLENEVKPSGWFIHYKGGISPSQAGKFRFWGWADDVLVVAINGRTVLDVSRGNLPSKWVPKEPDVKRSIDTLSPGDWVELSDRETYRMDVLIGERPGVQFRAVLLVEQSGKKYEIDGKGNIIPAVFSTLPLSIADMPKLPNAPKVDAQAIIMTPKRNVITGGTSLKSL
jgi:hypothetical protein